MRILTEGDLQFDFTTAQNAIKFDNDFHGMSHCMKAVDFVVEHGDKLLFIEIKDINAPNIRRNSQRKFRQSLEDKTLKREIIKKYTDSFLYKWAENTLNAPVTIWYIFLLEANIVQQQKWSSFNNQVRAGLPLLPPTNWQNSLIDDFQLHSLLSWNKYFPQFPVTRLSQSAT